MKLDIRWTKGLSTKDKSDLEYAAKHTPFILKRFKSIIEARLQELESLEVKVENYDKPAWPYLQADKNGGKRELKGLIHLLSFIDPKE